jgi:ABC-type polysaccharide/polyol phosphate transport system ATPase subunit
MMSQLALGNVILAFCIVDIPSASGAVQGSLGKVAGLRGFTHSPLSRRSVGLLRRLGITVAITIGLPILLMHEWICWVMPRSWNGRRSRGTR